MVTVKDKSYVALHGDRVLHVNATQGESGCGLLDVNMFGPDGHIHFRLETTTWADELRPLRDLLNSLELTVEVDKSVKSQ